MNFKEDNIADTLKVFLFSQYFWSLHASTVASETYIRTKGISSLQTKEHFHGLFDFSYNILYNVQLESTSYSTSPSYCWDSTFTRLALWGSGTQ